MPGGIRGGPEVGKLRRLGTAVVEEVRAAEQVEVSAREPGTHRGPEAPACRREDGERRCKGPGVKLRKEAEVDLVSSTDLPEEKRR